MSDVFPKDGVTAYFLCGEFVEELGGILSLQGLTTGQVIQDRIKPKTLDWKSSYCAWLRLRNHPAHRTTAHAFISHGHSYKFLDLIDALKHLLRDELRTTVVWIDFCSINQHAPMDWTFDWLSTTFKSAIQEMGRTIMVMSPWNDPLPFKRSWCVFEVYCAADATDCKFEIALSRKDEEQFLQDMLKNGRKMITEVLGTICSEKSEGNDSDKAAIFSVIRSSVGFSKLDAMVFERYRGWVIEVALGALNGCERKDKKYCDLLRVVAALYSSQGDYNNAESYSSTAMECAKSLFSYGDPYLLKVKNDSALVWYYQGKYSEAEEMFQLCLEKQWEILGCTHSSVLTTMNNLASVLQNQGKHNEAEKMYRTCVEQLNNVLGTDHADTITTINNLAWVLHEQGKYREAEEMYWKCLEQRTAELGKGHPHTLTIMNNLATVLGAEGKYNDAEAMFQTCLEQRKSKLGKEHPDTITTQNRMALALHKQDKYIDAEELLRLCLEQRKTILGECHPNTLATINNLNLLLEDQTRRNRQALKTTIHFVKKLFCCIATDHVPK